jgi:hypothetical protein
MSASLNCIPWNSRIGRPNCCARPRSERVLQRRLRDPDGERGDPHAAAVQPLQRVDEALRRVAQHLVVRDEELLLEGDAHRLGGALAHLVLLLPDDVALGVGGDDERADPAGAAPVVRGVGAAHGDHDVAEAAVGDPRLGAVQHPAAVDAPRLRGERGGVGARVRLREREAAEQLAARHRLQPALLLRVGAVGQDHLRGQRVVHAHRDRHGGVAPGDLLQRER